MKDEDKSISDQDFLEMYSAANNYTDQLTQENIINLNYYLRNPRGDERPNESKTVSSDCFDVVESDAPSLTRTFLGGGNIHEFKPKNPSDEAEVLECKQKTKLINKIVLGQENSFKVIYDWLKGAGIFNASPVTYYYRDTKKREIKVYTGITEIELESIIRSLDESDKVIEFSIKKEERDSVFDIEVEIYRERKEYVIDYIQPDKFLISRGGPSIDDCSFVGHIDRIRKGELIEIGIDKEIVKGLTGYRGASYADQSLSSVNSDQIDDKMQEKIGGDYNDEIAPKWYLEEVEVVWACVMAGTKNGAPDRRRILWADNKIIQDEPFDHVNYAVLSAYPLPGQVVGLSRVGITRHTQDQKTFVQRGMLNNMASVNKPMTAININKESSTVNQDDIRTRRVNGMVRVNGDPRLGVMPLTVPSIGAESLQLIQYLDFNRSQTTGALMASQGLNKDDIYNETATRFNGVSKEGAGKLENVMRVYTETGFRKLYRGLEWMVKHYQDGLIEEQILGEQIAYDPTDWRYDGFLCSSVGLAADDTSDLIENLGVIYNTQLQLKSQGSMLVDDEKVFNTLTRILRSMNVHDNQSFYNDPRQPDQTVNAQNEQMKSLISQLQGQLEQSSFVEASKQIEELKGQIEVLKYRNKQAIDMAKLEEDARQFNVKAASDERARRADNAIKITELELENSTELPGGLDNE